ncbi:MAG: 5'-methylthioadenosine/adenosylhomocysteine nucleosidase [Bacilli bacterium]|nr:5'-methylthioadenosine/adenosylhomocysteine nucleosidase [Bacilli bacterium]
MKVGIIFAMEEELKALLEYLVLENEYNLFDLKFYEGTINDINCVLVESGVGKVNAARATQILIDNMNVEYIFNIGVAGGVSKDLNVGDIVIGEKLVQHDFDITAFDHEKGYIPNVGTFIEADPYLIKIAKENISEAKVGVIASGDIFCTELMMGKKINSKFKALCVEMEGASIAQVCFLCHIPFLIIRSISDVLGEDNKITYEMFLEKSSKKVALAMKNILENLKKIED